MVEPPPSCRLGAVGVLRLMREWCDPAGCFSIRLSGAQRRELSSPDVLAFLLQTCSEEPRTEKGLWRLCDVLLALDDSAWNVGNVAQAVSALAPTSPRSSTRVLRHVLAGSKGERFSKKDLDQLFADVLQHSLYAVSFFRAAVVLSCKSRLAEACRRLGPSWDVAVGGCFAAQLPWKLLSDEAFVRDHLSYVDDGGLSLQLCGKFAAEKRVVLEFVRRQACLQHTAFPDDEEVAAAAAWASPREKSVSRRLTLKGQRGGSERGDGKTHLTTF